MATANGNAAFDLQKHIEEMRSLIECKICLRPLYEPYMLGCGHTYCYSCLDHFFNGDRGGKKTCPDCRTIVRTQPAPNYLLRDLSQVLTARPLLLPEHETIAEHKTGQDEEAALISAHKAHRGLFRGLFERRAPPPWPTRVMYDEEDGVHRCPLCYHEIEDGRCPLHGSLSDSDADSIDEDEAPGEMYLRAPAFPGLDTDSIDSDEDDEDDGLGYGEPLEDSDESEGGDDDSEMDRYDLQDDFIDNVNEDDDDGIDFHAMDDTGYSHVDSTPYGSDASDEEDVVRHGRSRQIGAAAHEDEAAQFSELSHDSSEGENSDEDEDGDIRPAIRNTRQKRRRPNVVESDDEDEDINRPRTSQSRRVSGSDDDDQDDEEIIQRHVRPAVHRRFAPLPISDDEDGSDSVSDQESSMTSDIMQLDGHHSDAEPDAASTRSDVASSQSNASHGAGTPQQDAVSSDESEASDDTAIPPQTQRARRERLERKRKRRPIVQVPTTLTYTMPNGRHRRRERSTAVH